MPLVFPLLSGPLCPSLHLLLFSAPPPFLCHLLLPTLVTSPSLLFSSPSLLHNRCGCNGSQLERHDEAALETESETEKQRAPQNGFFYHCAPTRKHARKHARMRVNGRIHSRARNLACVHALAHSHTQARRGCQPGRCTRKPIQAPKKCPQR